MSYEDYGVLLEKIARSFNGVDVDDLTDLEADIVMKLTESGYLDMDEVTDEDGEFMYNVLCVVSPIV